jgi:hypothetical protein
VTPRRPATGAGWSSTLRVEFDLHTTGACVFTLDEDESCVLRDARSPLLDPGVMVIVKSNDPAPAHHRGPGRRGVNQ